MRNEITKGPSERGEWHRPLRFFCNARTAFETYLQAAGLRAGDAVLLPSYVGSGVFDPIANLNLSPRFYRMDHRLHIDIESLESELERTPIRAVVLIHYFGYVDPCYAAAVALARRHGALVIEDEAHAMFTDLIGGRSGRLGDVCLYSFHKMLAVESGGALVFNNANSPILKSITGQPEAAFPLWEYDLHTIAKRRVDNAHALLAMVESLETALHPLRPVIAPGEVPQSFPIVLHYGDRDRIYHEMNAAGFGVVSLYHTLV